MNISLIFPQINDEFTQGVLEEGNYDLLDVTDYHNMNLIVSTSKNIYTGIPPNKKVETNANLIKVSSLITINHNYLLAACLEDSFLGKINLSNGNFISLVSYEEVGGSEALEIPKTICSLSNIDKTIFIGYSKIKEISEVNYVKRTIFKVIISNEDSIEEGPSIDTSVEIDSFSFDEMKMETVSLRQISCEPLRIIDNTNDYRLVCLHESITIFTYDTFSTTNYDVFAASINSGFDDFETTSKEENLNSRNRSLGFRIYRENDTYARVVTGDTLIEIYLKQNTYGEIRIKASYGSYSSLGLNAEIDLISYNNKFIFSAEKTSFMGKNNIYSLRINQVYYSNYFQLYNYLENKIHKILGYYNGSQNKIIFLYQTDNNIKFFIMDNIIDIYAFPSKSTTINLGSYEETQYDLNGLITTLTINDLGKLNVDYIKYKISSTENLYEYFGIDFYQTSVLNNNFIPEPSLNDKKTYYFSFIDNTENEYTRIYRLKSLTVKIQTCQDNCYSCWEEYDTCTDCENNENYAPLDKREDECFPPDYLVDGYIYDSSSKKFLECYESCEFCSAVSTSSLEQKCTSCLPGYLYSYVHLGNCYLYTDLDISDSKEVDTDENIFKPSSCSNYKISSTGECVNECPQTPSYFSYEYNEAILKYEPAYYNPPMYLFNNICYEQCPENSSPNANKECICNYYFYKDNNEDIVCLPDENCISEYSYLNRDTKECLNSLENCDYFFDDNCYSNCPSGKVPLLSQSETIQNYIKEKLNLNNILVNKICICDTTNGVWSNIDLTKVYYQECSSACPIGYVPEDISKQCVLKNTVDSALMAATSTTTSTTTSAIISSSNINKESNTKKATETQNQPNEEITDININNYPPPLIPINDDHNCPVKYEHRCYLECPLGTCLTQEDPELKTCVNKGPNTQVFNGICFDNLLEMAQNIKTISDAGQTLYTESGIIIHGYSTKTNQDDDKNSNYSLVDLGDCEYKLKAHYNLSNDTELFILGIDSPNKDLTSPISVYNYGVYLEDGTLLNHTEICSDSKILISSPITNPELLKLEEAAYFSDLGYDIFDSNSDFYNDNCAPASIGGNDIILSDRKKDFYPSNISLCNDSCIYSQVDLSSKRFTCECDLSYNYSEKVKKEENTEEEEDDTSYIEYFLSLINYKIIKCYKLFLEYKSYYYNAGFYITVGTLVFCMIQMFIFIYCGNKSIDIIVLENVPNEMKLRQIEKEQQKKWDELDKDNEKNNPPKKDSVIKFEKDKKKSRKTVQLKDEDDSKHKRKSKLKNRTTKFSKNSRTSKKENVKTQLPLLDSKGKLHIPKYNNITIVNSSHINNEIIQHDESSKVSVDSRELNIMPYPQALREDKRSCFKIFLSVISHEIKIISIFYYKHPYDHLSIILSHYFFELCLDLTLNGLLYTEDVISEKYNNNGSIRFFTSLSLSFFSNIISSIICYFVSKLAEYAEFFEFIIKDVTIKSKYYLNIMNFKKLLCIKLSFFFIIQFIINLVMCYYLTIFCAIYHNTQGSIMINYLTGIAESMAISFGLTLITSILRVIAIKCRSKYIYYTSKYFFENF